MADPRDDLDRLELRMEIDLALRALPDDQRSAVVLVDVEGLSVAEAAELLGIPEGTVKSRCSRGRARLAVALRGVRNPDASADVTPGPAPLDPAPGSPDERRPARTTGGDPMTDRTPDGVADTPGPDATPEQDSDVRALLAFLRDQPMEMPPDVAARLERRHSRRNGVRRAPPGPPPRR